ncbi:hypothetical protein MA16_Dca016159 [Dendrobium catenatum]|uniref:Uncharacterized protein n=1 Tax=Dendrobium catenatum TaxID=906689 RepID=A0A2I0WBR9_9ASPA|nr:hypothetical protein MA16_Dca016159 [Dendrobium catenatum]
MMVSSNKFVNVPMNLIDTQALVYHVGDNSGMDVRTHLDWLHCTSEFEFDYYSSSDYCGGYDPRHDFKLVRDRPVHSVASHGRFRGRGMRGR